VSVLENTTLKIAGIDLEVFEAGDGGAAAIVTIDVAQETRSVNAVRENLRIGSGSYSRHRGPELA
jgi:hypothetical protein